MIAIISKCFTLIHLIFIIYWDMINIPILHMRELRPRREVTCPPTSKWQSGWSQAAWTPELTHTLRLSSEGLRTWVTWAFSCLTEGCFRSWGHDPPKENRPDYHPTVIYCLLWRMTNSERSVWASLGPRCPALPGPANVKSSKKQRQETTLASFLPFLMFHDLCQKLCPTIDYTIQHLPMCTQIWKKQGAEKNWRRPNTFRTARLGKERFGTFLLPCSLMGMVSSWEWLCW